MLLYNSIYNNTSIIFILIFILIYYQDRRFLARMKKKPGQMNISTKHYRFKKKKAFLDKQFHAEKTILSHARVLVI